MNQFDALKARVAERRSVYGRRGEVDDDVDVAIAIIETDMIPALERAIDLQVELITGRTQARAAVLALRDDWLRIAKLNPIRKEQVGQGPMDDVCRFCGGMAPYIPNAEVEHKDCVWALAQRRVADTAHYEAFRQA